MKTLHEICGWRILTSEKTLKQLFGHNEDFYLMAIKYVTTERQRRQLVKWLIEEAGK